MAKKQKHQKINSNTFCLIVAFHYCRLLFPNDMVSHICFYDVHMEERKGMQHLEIEQNRFRQTN